MRIKVASTGGVTLNLGVAGSLDGGDIFIEEVYNMCMMSLRTIKVDVPDDLGGGQFIKDAIDRVLDRYIPADIPMVKTLRLGTFLNLIRDEQRKWDFNRALESVGVDDYLREMLEPLAALAKAMKDEGGTVEQLIKEYIRLMVTGQLAESVLMEIENTHNAFKFRNGVKKVSLKFGVERFLESVEIVQLNIAYIVDCKE